MIRPYTAADESAVVAVWHRAGLVEYTYLPLFQALTREKATAIFREHILANNDIWVGVQDGRIVAYLAISGSFLDRLYVDPAVWRRGWGSRLVDLAKALSPSGLELFTHVENHSARALYERHGFVAVKFGLSPPPESVPDVEYLWRPRRL